MRDAYNAGGRKMEQGGKGGNKDNDKDVDEEEEEDEEEEDDDEEDQERCNLFSHLAGLEPPPTRPVPAAIVRYEYQTPRKPESATRANLPT
eukprot:4005318-Pyramimonas_sp.AAC.1